MPRITYTGPFTEVDVPALGCRVAQGETVDAPDDLAASLLEQAPDWTPAATTSKKKEA